MSESVQGATQWPNDIKAAYNIGFMSLIGEDRLRAVNMANAHDAAIDDPARHIAANMVQAYTEQIGWEFEERGADWNFAQTHFCSSRDSDVYRGVLLAVGDRLGITSTQYEQVYDDLYVRTPVAYVAEPEFITMRSLKDMADRRLATVRPWGDNPILMHTIYDNHSAGKNLMKAIRSVRAFRIPKQSDESDATRR